MKRILIVILVITMMILSTATAWGSVVGFGARAIGMGGAYTAIADDEYSAYWNPAGVTTTKHMELLGGLDFLGDLDKLDRLQKVSKEISDHKLPDRNDLNNNIVAGGYLGFEAKYFGLSVYTDPQITTTVDSQTNLRAIFDGSVNGVVTVAGKIGDQWAVGINFKNVYVGYGDVNMPALPTDPQALLDYRATMIYYTGSGSACDIGLLYNFNPQINLGITARNIFSDVKAENGRKYFFKFDPTSKTYTSLTDEPYTGTIKLPKTYILGISYKPYETGLLAADIETITDSANDQTRIHVGYEQTALWNSIALRVGCFTSKDNPLGYTAGLGLKIWVFYTNLAMVSVNSNQEYVLSGSVKF